MPAPAVLFALMLAASADTGDDEARIEQLIHQSGAHKPAAAKTASAQASAKKTDPASASIGHQVRIRTIERGLYVGTLLSVDANDAVLRIALPPQALSYTLPRSGIAELEDLGPAP
jgi:hypothetical protein